MSWRSSALLLLTFVFIFGWKVTETFDLVLVSSAAIAFWVFLFEGERLGSAERRIAACLLLLALYALLISLIFGAADVQTALRSVRALINFVGGVGLTILYFRLYREQAAARLGLAIFLCIVLHALLICGMFASAALRNQVYALVSTYSYVNMNAPILLGLRIPGLTYGLASTSVVQLCGLLLLPLVLRNFGKNALSSSLLWAAVPPILVSMFLTGRTGLLLGAALIPVALLALRGSRPAARGRRLAGTLAPLVIVAIAIGAVVWRYGSAFQETFAYTLQHAGELLELVERGSSESTDRISSMYFLPDDAVTLLIGSSNSGRGDLAYIASDVGYVKLIFAVGLLGLSLNLLPYLLGMDLARRCYEIPEARALAVAAGLCLLAGVLLNFKELALLTRNQWSIQALLIAACAMQLRSPGKQPAVFGLPQHA